jgi:hypothetical protein
LGVIVLEKEIDVERLADLKSYFERRLAVLESRAELYKGYIRAIDSVLTRASFKLAADILKENQVAPGAKPVEGEVTKEAIGARKIDLVSRADGSKLGVVTVSKSSITITPVENVGVPVDSSTFNSFFVKKILSNMIQKDEEQVELGKLTGKDKMGYKVSKNSDGTLKELVISNYRDESRLKQITTTIRWTLEKVAQKSAGT